MVNRVSTINICDKLYVIIAATWESRTNFSCHTRLILWNLASQKGACADVFWNILCRLNRVRRIKSYILSVAKVGVCDLLLE